MIGTAIALIRQRQMFSIPVYPWGDQAVNSLLAIRAEHFDLLVGNYSRVGFHHPGPALLYLLAGGETLFDHILHVVPAPYNGQLLGVSVYLVVFLALSAVVLLRLTRSAGVAVLAFSIGFVFAARMTLFGADWFPYLYMSAFLLFTVAAAAVAAGRTGDLPVYTLAAGVLVHGHVSFIFYVVVTTAVVAVAWRLRHRRGVRPELRGHRRALIGSAVILGVLLLPMVLEVIRHFPGPWGEYWTYISAGTRSPRTFGDALRFIGHYWSMLGVPAAVVVAAGTVAVILTAFERDRRRRRVFGWLYAMVLLQTALTLYYALRGVDELDATNVYVAYFYRTVPVVLTMAAAGQLWLWIRDALPERTRLSAVVHAAPVIGISVALLLVAGLGSSFAAVPPAPSEGYLTAADALATSPQRADRVIAVVQDSPNIWPQAAGIAVQLERSGTPWCVDASGEPWDLFYSPDRLCPGSRTGWLVHLTAATAPAGADVLWRGEMVRGTTVTAYTLP